MYFFVGHHLMLLLLSSSTDAFELGLNEPIHIRELLEPRLHEDRTVNRKRYELSFCLL